MSGVSMKLGRALAELKKKVLVIDADLRKSVVLEKIEGKKPEKELQLFYLDRPDCQKYFMRQTFVDFI